MKVSMKMYAGLFAIGAALASLAHAAVIETPEGRDTQDSVGSQDGSRVSEHAGRWADDATLLNVKLADLRTTAKLYDRENLAVLKQLVDSVAKSSDLNAQHIMTALIKLRVRGLGEKFDINPVEISAMLADPRWTPSAKAQFASIMTRAVEISETGPMTNQAAFEAAMNEAGLKAAYDSCKAGTP